MVQNEDGWTPLHACCHSNTTAKIGLKILEVQNIRNKGNKDPKFANNHCRLGKDATTGSPQRTAMQVVTLLDFHSEGEEPVCLATDVSTAIFETVGLK